MYEDMRDRLERIKSQPAPGRKPLTDADLDPEQAQRKPLTPEAVYMRKVDKLVARIEAFKKKMTGDSGQYLSLYYDLKKAEKDFIDIITEPEVQFMDLPDVWVRKIEGLRDEIMAKNK